MSEILPPADQRFVRQQLATLPARVSFAKEKETAEMMGKLKDVSVLLSFLSFLSLSSLLACTVILTCVV